MRSTERARRWARGGTCSTARRNLGVQIVSAVLGGEAEELVDVEFDGGMFEVWWRLKKAIGWLCSCSK